MQSKWELGEEDGAEYWKLSVVNLQARVHVYEWEDHATAYGTELCSASDVYKIYYTIKKCGEFDNLDEAKKVIEDELEKELRKKKAEIDAYLDARHVDKFWTDKELERMMEDESD